LYQQEGRGKVTEHKNTGTLFQFAVLQYAHDPVTREFLNVGVVVYSKDAKYLKCLLSRENERVLLTFRGVDKNDYAGMIDGVERAIVELEAKIETGTVADRISDLLRSILLPDDSCLKFDIFGGGLAQDLDDELRRLFLRMVKWHIRPTT